MRRLVGLIVLGCVLASAGGGVNAWRPAAAPGFEPGPAPPQVTLATDGLILEWLTPEASIMTRADGTVGVTLPGYLQTDQPGAPQLPFTSTLIALPPDASPVLHILLDENVERPLPGPLALAPIPDSVQRDEHGYPVGVAFSPAFASEAPFNGTGVGGPTAPVVLDAAGIVRGARLARLTFYPVRLAGEGAEARLRVTTHLRVSVAFNVSPPRSNAPSLSDRQPDDPLLAAVRSAVVNPNHVQSLPPQGRNLQSGIQNLNTTYSATVAIEVNTPGLTAITYEALVSAGFPVTGTDPHALYLTRTGSQVAAEWDGDGDVSFEPGERLLFYAEPRFSRWTATDVYFLRQDAAPGLRMSSRSADPTGLPTGVAWTDVTAEVNALYTPDCFCAPIPVGRDGDRWVWDYLARPGRETASYSIRTLAVDASRPATLTLWVMGYTAVAPNPDHRLDIALNGTLLGRVQWDGKTAVTATLSIPAGVLRSGDNTLSLSLPGIPGVSVEGMWLDAFAVRYSRGLQPEGASVIFGAMSSVSSTVPPTSTLPNRLYIPLVMRDWASGQARAFAVALANPSPYRAYDITDPYRPQRLTNIWVNGSTITLGDPPDSSLRRYLVTGASGIASPARVRAIQDPWSLHAGIPVTGTDALIIAHPTFASALPALVSLRQSQGLATVMVNALGVYDAWGDGRPDPATLRTFISDTYHTFDPRPTFVLLVGDGSFDPKGYRPDSTVTFVPPYLADVEPWAGEGAADNRYVAVDGDDALPDMLIGRLPVKTLAEAQVVVDKITRYETQPLPGGWNANVAFVADDADPPADFAEESEIIASTYITPPFTAQRIYYTPPTSTVPATQQAVLGRWNAGALIIQYTGHSSWREWAVEDLLYIDDLPKLRNDRRWPIVVEMTCFTAAFQRPEPTLDEELVNLSGGGAVAAWGPTSLGLTGGHHVLADGFYKAFQGGASTLGDAAFAGKLELYGTGLYLDQLDTFVILGDPATRFSRTMVAWAHQLYLPMVTR